MPSDSLAALAVVVPLVVAGCLGGGSAPTATGAPTASGTTTATPTSATAPESVTAAATGTTTDAETTAGTPCSLDANATVAERGNLSNVSKPASLSSTTARRVAETVESRYQSARVDERSYYNHHVRSVVSVERVERGYRVVLRAELDYDRRGGPDATVVHVHRPYTVFYRVTDRGVVRRGEAGVTGTVVCW